MRTSDQTEMMEVSISMSTQIQIRLSFYYCVQVCTSATGITAAQLPKLLRPISKLIC